MPHRRSPSPPVHFPSVAARSMWKAGRRVSGAARAGIRTAAKPTADQIRVLGILLKLWMLILILILILLIIITIHSDGQPRQNCTADLVAFLQR